MKKLLIIAAFVPFMFATTAFAISYFTHVDAKNAAVVNNDYFGSNNMKVFRFQDTVGTTTITCYTMLKTSTNLGQSDVGGISCVK